MLDKLRIMLIFLLNLSLLGAAVQPQTTPEQEEVIIMDQAKKPIAPLSEALKDLIQGISDQTFDQSFINKIAKLEKEKFTGEFIDTWEDGQMKIKAFFKEGKVDGHVHGWYSDGLEAFKAFFYENKKVGIHIAFYPKAPRQSIGRYARILSYDFNGKLDDKQCCEYLGNRLKTLIRFKHGILHGHMCLYNSDRKCIKDLTYEEGKIVSPL